MEMAVREILGAEADDVIMTDQLWEIKEFVIPEETTMLTDLKLLPLNVTDEDWAISGAVDQMILDLGKDITLESEAAIKEARSAYENLSWRYKALIQEADTLRECEVELLERKIEKIDKESLTADALPALQELVDVYSGMTSRQQNYVKNYLPEYSPK